MNEAEFLEIINLHAANTMTSFTVFVTFLFGYMTVAYFVGTKLSSLQVIIVSLIYAVAAIVWAVVSITHSHSFESLVTVHPNFVPSPFWKLPWSALNLAMTTSALAASLYFMYDVRSKNNETNDRST